MAGFPILAAVDLHNDSEPLGLLAGEMNINLYGQESHATRMLGTVLHLCMFALAMSMQVTNFYGTDWCSQHAFL